MKGLFLCRWKAAIESIIVLTKVAQLHVEDTTATSCLIITLSSSSASRSALPTRLLRALLTIRPSTRPQPRNLHRCRSANPRHPSPSATCWLPPVLSPRIAKLEQMDDVWLGTPCTNKLELVRLYDPVRMIHHQPTPPSWRLFFLLRAGPRAPKHCAGIERLSDEIPDVLRGAAPAVNIHRLNRAAGDVRESLCDISATQGVVRAIDLGIGFLQHRHPNR